MSASVWCDFGQHAFSTNDNDAVQDTIKMRVRQGDGTYRDRTYQRDICGPHVAEAVSFQRPQITEGDTTNATPNRTP